MTEEQKQLVEQYRQRRSLSLDPFTDEQVFEMCKDSMSWATMVFEIELRRLYKIVGEEFEKSTGGQAVRKFQRLFPK